MRVFKLLVASSTRNYDVDCARRSSSISTRSYKKLAPLPDLTLSILKLDGSVFEIDVGRSATIEELKRAVEVVFSSSQTKIPWSLVWGHFCLCHLGQKLTSDEAHIRSFGIKDGDQIQFIRHMSISNMPLEKQSRNKNVSYKQPIMLSYGSNGREDHVENGSEDLDNNAIDEDDSKCHLNTEVKEGSTPALKLARLSNGHQEDIEKGSDDLENNVIEEDKCHLHKEVEVSVPAFKLARYPNGWFSYSKVKESFKKWIRRQD